jgi:hypothetical protein
MFDRSWVRSRPALRSLALAALVGLAGVAAPALAADDSSVPARGDQATGGGSARELEPLAGQSALPPGSTAPVGRSVRTPLMELLDRGGLAKPLDDARIRVYGHIEGSYTYNFVDPPNNPADYKPLPGRGFTIPTEVDNPGRVFDVENQELTLNQWTINVERPIELSPTNFDFGGRMEWMYGSDARFIHSSGLFDNHVDDESGDVVGGPENQFDLTQLYLDFNVPVGNGLRLRAGKFTYFKQVDPNNSVFYSHSFTFGGALPFTLTGLYGTYRLNDRWTFDLGFSRGWDQTLEDNNDAIDVFGRVAYTISRDTRLAAAFIAGPEQDDDNGNWRTAIDVTLSHQVNPDLTLLFDAVYGYQAQGTFIDVAPGGGFVATSEDAQWYGLSGYAIQRINENFTAAARLEVYRDEDGYTTAVAQTLYEATVGLTITPFPHDPYGQFFKIRPELRYDYSTENFFDGFSKHYQVTAAVDAIFNF